MDRAGIGRVAALPSSCIVQDRVTAAGHGAMSRFSAPAIAGRAAPVTIDEVMRRRPSALLALQPGRCSGRGGVLVARLVAVTERRARRRRMNDGLIYDWNQVGPVAKPPPS